MKYIAGHSFPEFGPCACHIHWTTIRNPIEVADIEMVEF